MPKTISKEDKSKFLDLACQLSPENLNCDGEISRDAAESRATAIWNEWGTLEAKVGHCVTEDEVWKWEREEEL